MFLRVISLLGLTLSAGLTSATIFESGFEIIEKPGPDNTGPYDESLLEVSSSVTIRDDGTLLENVDISGRIRIEANNVTIRNFRIDGGGTHYGIQIASGYSGIHIEDGEIFNVQQCCHFGCRIYCQKD